MSVLTRLEPDHTWVDEMGQTQPLSDLEMKKVYSGQARTISRPVNRSSTSGLSWFRYEPRHKLLVVCLRNGHQFAAMNVKPGDFARIMNSPAPPHAVVAAVDGLPNRRLRAISSQVISRS